MGLEYLNFGGVVKHGIFRLKMRLGIMVEITILNGNKYIECEKCGAYEFYEVSRLHVEQDGAKEWLCRGCIPLSCVVSKSSNEKVCQ